MYWDSARHLAFTTRSVFLSQGHERLTDKTSSLFSVNSRWLAPVFREVLFSYSILLFVPEARAQFSVSVRQESWHAFI